ncbi:MAG: ribosome small subunit-dependent GTPase A [Betaproteobacteria bacterium]|nr:ribosome small subunit-dependent GTPase A [Betaproteobacteria bacterium]
MSTLRGDVVAGYGRDTLVRSDEGETLRARTRKRSLQAVCGDRVQLEPSGRGHAIIVEIEPRRTVFARASARRTKILAANVSQVVILVACEPSFSDELLARVLVAAERASLPALIALNKVDLAERRTEALAQLAPFRGLGYPVVELAARIDPEPLRVYLQRQRSVLVGQSGMGKSTLVKALVPDAQVRIQEISTFLDAGRQTTTAARFYPLDAVSELVDTPGVSEFGLADLSAAEIAAGFREFSPYAGHCRFTDCRHLAEPDCALAAAAEAGRIHPRRLALYRRILGDAAPGVGARRRRSAA